MTVQDILNLMIESPYATGPDISRYQGHFDLDAVRHALKIVDFVVLRVGFGALDGKTYKDPKFEEMYAELEEHPSVLRGGYWYNSSNMPWEKQRDAYLRYIDGKEIDFHSGDFEGAYNTKSAGFALTYIRYLKSIRRETGKRVLNYTSRVIYDNWLKPYTNEIDNFPLWHAQYPWRTWSNVTDNFLGWWGAVFTRMIKQPYLPKSRNGAWEIWQVGAKTGLGKALGVGSADIDINITRRLREDFYEWVGRPARWDGELPPEPKCRYQEFAGEIIDSINTITESYTRNEG